MMGTFPQGIYISEDDGATWTESNVGWTRDGCFRLVSHPRDPDHVFAGTYNGINQSRDFGKIWERSDQGWPPEQWVFSIDFSPQDPEIMVACSKNGENEGRGRDDFRGTVMRSDDGGDSWYHITNGLNPEQEFYEILFDKNDPEVVYLAAQQQGVMISVDGGMSWENWNDGLDGALPATNGNNVTRCLVLSSDGESLIFGTNGSGVYQRKRYQR
ncbi:MAG: hypothetical protein KAR21_02865 [Spirochaetales bacterium]|nr:hypothetical protein [Spirochaetales bacterium]